MNQPQAGALETRIRDDLNTARRARDKQNTTLLSTILSEIKNQKIEAGHELSDAEVTDVLTRAIKKRREAAEQMRAGQRTELAETANVGAVMKEIAPQIKGRFDGKEANRIVREEIG